MPFNINGNILTNLQVKLYNDTRIVRSGLVYYADAGISNSYPGSGTTWYDLSGNSNNGTLTNGPTFNNSNGGSIVFDGSNDYVTVPYNSTLNTPSGATYEIWIYPTAAGEFLTRGTSDSGATPDNPRFYVGSGGTIYFDWSTPGADTYVDTTAIISLNTWSQIIGVAAPNSQLRVYFNGGTEASYGTVVRAIGSTVPNTSDPLIIGGATWIPRYFAGRISSVKLYNKVLSTSEMLQNYNANRSRFGI
jgi:hypothetical protein